MFSGRMTTTSTADFSAEISRLKNVLQNAAAVVIGAGAGLSTAAGFTYTGERFEKYFSDFIKKYGFTPALIRAKRFVPRRSAIGQYV